MQQPAPLVVGFDLDMTLIDTRPGFMATLSVLAEETGVVLDVHAMSERLGPPLDLMLAPHYPHDELPGLVDRFRAHYPDHAIASTPAFPGAHEALAAVRRNNGRSVVVTGKYRPNAALHLDALGLDADALVGEVWGTGKGPALVEHGASIYVGDHVHDVEGAQAAGALSVSVLTGGCTEQELRDAGTDVVLRDLTELPAWLDDHLLAQRLAALEEQLHDLGSVLVAYSGGADSAFLLAAAVRALGPEHVGAATAYSDSLPQSERSPARDFADELGVRVYTPETHEMEREGYRANAGDRCYFCKAELLDVLGPIADAHGLRGGRDRDQRRRRGRGVPPGHPCGRRARGGHPAARRRLHQGPGAGRLPRLGPADLGQAGGGLPVEPGRVRHRGQPVPAGARGAGGGGRPGRPGRDRDRRARPAGAGPGRHREPGGRRGTRRAGPGHAGRAGSGARGGVRRRRGGPERVPVRLDERAAGRAGTFPVTAWSWGTAHRRLGPVLPIEGDPPQTS